MKKECLNVNANGIDFYCEIRGQGPLLVLYPDGSNDCGAYDKLASLLAEDFRVLSFDPRGGSRSMDKHPTRVTPKSLADDAAAILLALGLRTASFYGCSSGGQAVLAMAQYYPEMCEHIMVHEAALQSDTPIHDAGMLYFQQVNTYQSHCPEFDAGDIGLVTDYNKWMELDPDCRARMKENELFWSEYYLGTADSVSYSEEELKKMKHVSFTVGCWSAAWIVAANIATAKRGGFPYTWLLSSHSPHITCPEMLAEHIRNICK